MNRWPDWRNWDAPKKRRSRRDPKPEPWTLEQIAHARRVIDRMRAEPGVEVIEIGAMFVDPPVTVEPPAPEPTFDEMLMNIARSAARLGWDLRGAAEGIGPSDQPGLPSEKTP